MRYDYSAPVSLNPHTLRLVPRSDGFQRLVDLRWEILPAPTGTSRNRDLHGNDVLQAWFTGAARVLTVRVKAHVETLRPNPFDFTPTPAGFPVDYGPASSALEAFRHPSGPDLGLDALVGELRSAAADDAGAFPALACRRLYEVFERERREDGAARSPAQSWVLKRGACRDVAVLFLDLCRRVGFAGRYVSGYHDDDAPGRRKDLHAWAEIYIHGGGWRGYDPSTGLAVADRHVAVAAGGLPDEAAALSGTYAGTAASTFRYAVSLRRLS